MRLYNNQQSGNCWKVRQMLALRGIAYRPAPAGTILRRNLLIYGLGGMLLPFPFIKAIDLLLVALHLA